MYRVKILSKQHETEVFKTLSHRQLIQRVGPEKAGDARFFVNLLGSWTIDLGELLYEVRPWSE